LHFTTLERQVLELMVIRIQTVIAGAAFIVGLAIAAVVLYGSDPSPDIADAPRSDAYLDFDAATEERIRALEIAVGEERNARQLLEEELGFLLDELEQIRSGESGRRQENTVNSEAVRVAESNRTTIQQPRSELSSPEGRTRALVAAGFSPDRAASIVQREAELQMGALQARYDARQSGTRPEPGSLVFNPDAALRAELGESDYVMYREAYGQPTSVAVGSVMHSSPAEAAGLQAGDRIISYGGARVFSNRDLNAQTMQGTPGQNVLVEIERDGVPTQVVLPRGPLGISIGGR
jgi:hypothetical protein